ncbi:MAG: hypothetical protein IPH69_08740 [Bacteroidales bacterium]|nr:hypothetical protein [Bacteroidales bacterium]
MNSSEIKKLLISSISTDADPSEVSARLEKEGISYDFSKDFTDKVLDRIFETKVVVTREIDFVRSLNFAFYRIALTGVAAIVVLLISIFLMEGSLSFNSFLGLSDSYDETIVSLLTGN